VFIPTSPMIASSARGGAFSIPAGFIHNPSLGMPPEFVVPTGTEAPAQTHRIPSAEGSVQGMYTIAMRPQPQAHSNQLLVSPVQTGGPLSPASASQQMVPYQT
jgi:hypothetical protein